MKKEVPILDGVAVTVHGREVRVEGPHGKHVRSFLEPSVRSLVIERQGETVVVSSSSERKKARTYVGTVAAHIRNMIHGSKHGYRYTMRIHYTHFPIAVTTKGKEIQIRNFLGEKGARIAYVHGDAAVTAGKEEITITGHNKEDVGQTAAAIERACRVGKKDRRIFVDGIYIESRGAHE